MPRNLERISSIASAVVTTLIRDEGLPIAPLGIMNIGQISLDLERSSKHRLQQETDREGGERGIDFVEFATRLKVY